MFLNSFEISDTYASVFNDVYRFFSISPPSTILADLCFDVITGKIVLAVFSFFAFLSEK